MLQEVGPIDRVYSENRNERNQQDENLVFFSLGGRYTRCAGLKEKKKASRFLASASYAHDATRKPLGFPVVP
jgi:hypothetical protein